MLKASKKHLPDHRQSPLFQWLHRTVGRWGVQAKFRMQGNNLHILCEGDRCPERTTALLWLITALQQTDPNTLLPAGSPPIYQVVLYGRKMKDDQPDWSAQLHLNQLEQHLSQLQAVPSADAEVAEADSLPHSPAHPVGVLPVEAVAPAIAPSTDDAPPIPSPPPLWPTAPARSKRAPASPVGLPGGSALVLSNRSLAKQGQPDAIARYLSETLSGLGVAVQVTAKTLSCTEPGSAERGTISHAASHPNGGVAKRLWITCQAPYSPEPAVIAEPIACQLRELELEGFRDALVSIQVTGEAKPDWVLRVDLTPTREMLREWARWSDIAALQRLLNQALTEADARLATATLTESTLHLCFSVNAKSTTEGSPVPNQAAIRAIAAPLLELLAPQGIHAAALYGQIEGEEVPAWLDWLDLPAKEHPALAESTFALAQAGNWDAIAFLLLRLLNPDLDKQLATGGVRLQLLPKQDLLHVMADAPTCPDQKQVGKAIARFLRELKLPNLNGVRVYGRRAGQKRPLWSYGVDFHPRQRLVPEATPEFAATDAYIGDLIAYSEDQILRPELTPADLQTVWVNLRQRVFNGIQQGLTRSQLFTLSAEATQLAVFQPQQSDRQAGKVAVIWGAVGMLLLLQFNWLLGQAVQSVNSPSVAVASDLATPPRSESELAAAEPEPIVDLPLPDVQFQQSSGADASVFNSSGFTQPGGASISLSDPAADPTPANPAAAIAPPPQLPASPIRVAPATVPSPYATFNSRQLDEKIALYYQFLEQSGPPDVLILGSSRALRGIDPVALRQSLAQLGYTDVSIFNFGVNGATAQVANLVLQQLLTPDQLPRLILWADGARAFNSGTVDITYNGIVASEGYQQLVEERKANPPVDPAASSAEGAAIADAAAPPKSIHTTLAQSYQAIDRWLSERLVTVFPVHQERDRLIGILQQGVDRVVPPTPIVLTAEQAGVSVGQEPAADGSPSILQNSQDWMDFEGFMPLSLQFNPATYYQKYARVAGEYDSDYKDFKIEGHQAEAFRSLLQFTQAREIPVIFVNLPLTDQYLDPVRLNHEQTFKQYLVKTAVEQRGFLFQDLGEVWLSQYDYFSDPSHLNRYGAYEVARRVAQDPMIPWAEVGQP